MPSPRPLPLGSTFNPGDDQIPVWSTPDDSYIAALEQTAPGITAMIPTQQAAGESWMDTLARSLPIIAATVQQKQILDIQVQRAKAGLPPLDASQYAAGVNIGLSPEVQKILIMGAVGIGAVILLARR